MGNESGYFPKPSSIQKCTDENLIQIRAEELEDLYLVSDLDLSWVNPYGWGVDNLLETAIATLALYDEHTTLFEIVQNEEDIRVWDPYLNPDAELVEIMDSINAMRINIAYLSLREDNLLNPPDSTSWQSKMNHEIAKLIIQDGQPMSFNPTAYSWLSTSIDSEVIAAFDVKEDRWTEFAGTFATKDDSCTGFTLDVLYESGQCRKLRYEGELGSMMRKLESR